MITIMLYDYLKTNFGVKDLPWPGIEPQPLSPQSDATTIRPSVPYLQISYIFCLKLSQQKFHEEVFILQPKDSLKFNFLNRNENSLRE